MLREFIRRPVIRWSLMMAVVIGVGSIAWINLTSFDVVAVSSGFPVEEHRVFRAAAPAETGVKLATPRRSCSECASDCPATASRDVAAPAAGESYDWPALFGMTANSISPSPRVQTQWPAAGPGVRWQRDIGKGYSAPVVRGGKLIAFYRTGDEEIVEALDAKTGESLWTFRYPTTFQIKVHYSDGPYSTPCTDEQHVYAWSAQGMLRRLTLAKGALVWQRDTSADFEAVANEFPVASSPLLEDGKLILNVGGKSQQAGIVALDAKTGETLWTATDHLASYATPVAATIHGQSYVFVFTQTGLVALDPSDGRVFWTVNYRSMNQEFVNTTSPLVVENFIVLSGWSLGGMCIEVLPDGKYAERWRDRRGLDSQYVNLVSDGRYIYGCAARDSTYRCVDLRTGKVRWAWDNDIIGRGAYAIVVGRRAILAGELGKLASLELGGDEPMLRAMTGQRMLADASFTMPALANGLLYWRNESTLRCLDLTLEQ